MHFDRGVAIFQGIFFRHGAVWQFSFLTNRHESKIQFIGQYGAKNKSTGIYARNEIEALSHVAIDEHVDEHTEAARILQYRRDIAERNARLGPVRHAANGIADIDSGINMHGEDPYTRDEDNPRSVHNAV